MNCGCGLCACSACSPCYACHWRKGDENDNCPHRTFEGIREKCEEWRESGADPLKLKDYYNCRSPPLSCFPRFGVVSDYIPPPSLHLKLGIVNQVFKGLEAAFPGCDAWPQKLGIQKADYHGTNFEGRECDTLLESLSLLAELISEDKDGQRVSRSGVSSDSHPAEPFLQLFQAFKAVKRDCFGYDLRPNWEDSITGFKDAFRKSGNLNKLF